VAESGEAVDVKSSRTEFPALTRCGKQSADAADCLIHGDFKHFAPGKAIDFR